MRKKKILLMLALACPLSAFAWGQTGHMTIAEIAIDYLQNQPAPNGGPNGYYMQRYNALVQNMKSEDFQDDYSGTYIKYESDPLEIAHWPDDLRSEGDSTSAGWHYENNIWYFNQTPTVLDVATMDPSNAPWAIGQMVQILTTDATPKTPGQSGDYLVANGNLSGRALSFLVHFVGDAHQPLHCSQFQDPTYFPTGDAGGNGIAVKTPADQPYAADLHALWDGGLGYLSTNNTTFASCVIHPVNSKYPALNPACVGDIIFKDPSNQEAIKDIAASTEQMIATNLAQDGNNLGYAITDMAKTWCGPAYKVVNGQVVAVSPTPEWYPLAQQAYQVDGKNFVFTPITPKYPGAPAVEVTLDDNYFTAVNSETGLSNNQAVQKQILDAGVRLGVILQVVFDQEQKIQPISS